jgi:hypothetical protein
MSELSEITPFKPFEPMKSSAIPDNTLHYDIGNALNELAVKLFTLDSEYYIEQKFDGFHGMLHKQDNQVKIYTEHKNDITKKLPTIAEQAARLSPQDFIIDGELVPYINGQPMGRREMMQYITGKQNTPDDSVRYFVWDIPYFNGKPLSDTKLYERKKILNTLDFKKTPNIKEVPPILVRNKEELVKAVSIAKRHEKSEGAMIKDINSIYTPNSKTSKWIKFRKASTLRVKIIAVNPADDSRNYSIGIPIPSDKQELITPSYNIDGMLKLGNTFNTPVNAAVGDSLEIIVQEVWRHTTGNKIRYSLHKPLVLSKTHGTSSLIDLDRIAVRVGAEIKEAMKEVPQEIEETAPPDETRSAAAEDYWKHNWWRAYPKSGRGRFVYHHHWRGLSEEEADSATDETLLKTSHSLHGDLRFEGADGLYGYTIFLGETGTNKPDKLIEDAGDLQCAPKLKMPHEWLTIGKNKGDTSKPGGVGATSQKHAKFFILDEGTYDLGVMREHMQEYFLHGSKLKGRILIEYAPVGDSRKWLITRPRDQTPYADSHSIDKIRAELKQKNQQHLVWSKPNTKPELITI